MPSIRVDGNDVLAVYEATRAAVERARRGEGPTLIEALTYRLGAHSTSDDPSKYRDESITEEWKTRCPIARFRSLLIARGLWSEQEEAAFEGKRSDHQGNRESPGKCCGTLPVIAFRGRI